MGVDQIKSLMQIGIGARGLNWKDLRPRSPKALGDVSQFVLPNLGARGYRGVQNFNYELISRFLICNDMVWTCINLVSSTTGLGKLKVRKVKGKSLTYLDNHPLQRTLDFPNSSMTQFDLLQAYVTHQLLFGNVTMLLMRDGMLNLCPACISDGNDKCLHTLYLNNTGPITQIVPVHPSNIVEKKVTINGEIQNMFFYCPNGYNFDNPLNLDNNRTLTEYPVHPNNILTDPIYNPDAGWYGISPTYLLQRWLDLDTSMTNQITSFFDNGSIPSMIVSLKPGTNFTYDEEPNTLVSKMKEQWMRQFSKEGETEKAPAFVYGDIQVQKIQEHINDMIGKEIYYTIQDHVCATYGVPKGLYEIGLKYSAKGVGATQPEQDFYNRTISVLLARIKNKINQLIVSSYNERGLEVTWDLQEMGIASFILEKQETKIENHWTKGLVRRDEARIMLGYEPSGDEFGNDYYRLTVMGDGTNTTTNQLTPVSDKPSPIDNNLVNQGENAIPPKKR